MYIRNGQNISNISNIGIGNESNVISVGRGAELPHVADNSAVASNIPDISEIKTLNNGENAADYSHTKREEDKRQIRKFDRSHGFKKRARFHKNTKKSENKTNRLTKYLYERKYLVLLFSVIYITGLIIGAALIKNIDTDEIIVLRNVIDGYFTDVSSADMISRIINNTAINGLLLFLAYLSGVTVFAPIVCASLCLYKGLSCGYIMGIYTAGGVDFFHVKICCLTFVFYLLIMLCFILAFSESTGFSVFLLKSRESYRSGLSFGNIVSYSSRYVLLLFLTLLFTVLQMIVISLVYSVYY